MNIKGLFLASAAIAAFPIGAASAADLPVRMPVKAAPIAPLPFNWTGFYVGANAGVVWGRSVQTVDIDDLPLGIPADTSTYTGFIGGVQAGYNWQFSNVVLGIEADFDGSTARKSVATGPLDTHNMALNWLGTVRGRAGLAFDRFLPYVTGGVAFAGLKNELVDNNNPLTASRGNSATGWTVGGGVEYAFDNHWSAKAEYLYVKFPDKTQSFAIPGGYVFQTTFKDTDQIARIGLNYRF